MFETLTPHRVIQRMETGEECCVCEGTASECADWIDENAEQFEESTFWIEELKP